MKILLDLRGSYVDEPKKCVLPLSKVSFVEEINTVMNILLPENVEYDLSLDQSTSCTGISLCSVDNGIVLNMSIANNNKLSAEVYFDKIGEFLDQLLRGKKVRIFSYEDVPPSNRLYTVKMLTALHGRIQGWFMSIHSLKHRRFTFKVYPQSWKGYFFDSVKHKGKFNDMGVIAQCIVYKYPELTDLRNLVKQSESIFSDYDCFSSFGILQFCRDTRIDENERLINNSSKVQTGAIAVVYFSANQENAGERFRIFSYFAQSKKIESRIYDINSTIYENIVMGCVNGKVCFMEVKSVKHIISVALEFGYSLGDPETEHLVMAVMPASLLSSSFEKSFEQLQKGGTLVWKVYK